MRQEAVQERTLPSSYQPLQELPEHVKQAVWGWLVSKGIDPNMVITPMLYSTELGRLAFGSDGNYMARALHPNTQPKWVQYGERTGRYTLQGDSTSVIVEDHLSAIKVHYSTGYTVHAALGTRISAGLKSWLHQNAPANVLIMLDGDKAGRDGAVQMLQEVRFMGIPALIVYTEDGLDPKDYEIHKLKELLYVPSTHWADCSGSGSL